MISSRKSATKANTGPPAQTASTIIHRRPAGVIPRRAASAPAKARSVGILSTYPPTQCGLATFTASLRAGLLVAQPDLFVGIVRVGPAGTGEHTTEPATEVVHVIAPGAVTDGHEAARVLNKFDVAIIQHEYGIFAGTDGDQVLDIVERIRIPVILVVHTVLAFPTPNQRFVLEMLTQAADAVVTMSDTGRRRLLDDYRVDPRRLVLIPHGAPVTERMARPARPSGRPMILTWGLMNPGKGLEWGIAAMAAMNLLRPRPRYVIAGQTHPKVLAGQGERYREFLAAEAQAQGVSHLVEFEPGYLSAARVRELLARADAVLLPYNSREQVTSGVLTEAIAARVPVVSTSFPHAVELLADGRVGTLVPHRDPAAIAAALTRILIEPGVAEAMSAQGAGAPAVVSWPAVAGQYGDLFDALLRRGSTPSR